MLEKKEIAISLILCISVAGYYFYFDSKPIHEVPNLVSADNSFHTAITYGIEQEKTVRYRPLFLSNNTRIELFEPLVLYVQSAILSELTGLREWDTVWLWVIISRIFIGVGIFLLLRRTVGEWPALIALPLLVFPWEESFHYPFKIGFQIFHVGMLYLAFAVFLFYTTLKRNKDDKKVMAGLGLFITYLLYSHFSDVGMLVIFIILWIALSAIQSLERGIFALKTIILPSIVVAILSAYYLPYSIFAFGASESMRFGVPTGEPGGEPIINLNSQIMNPILLLFTLYGLYVFLNSKQKDSYQAVWVISYIIVAFFSNYVGFPSYLNYRMRYFSYLVLYPFAGLGIFEIIKRKSKPIQLPRFSIFASLGIIFIGITILNPLPKSIGSVINENMWSAFKWIDANTSQDSLVLFLGFNQIEGIQAHRNSRNSQTQYYISAVQNQVLVQIWKAELWAFWKGLPQRRGFFSYARLTEEDSENVSICDPDYLYFRTFSGQAESYALGYAYILQDTHKITFRNEDAVILEKISDNENCLGDGYAKYGQS